MPMIEIDGAQGEGGGQVVRSALALSIVTGRPFRIVDIRAKRRKPGLMRQHLTAVNAAAQVGMARVEGADVGSTTLTFEPGGVSPGDYHFSVGTAGSATLVFQTVFPPLALANGPSTVRVEGGTHNPLAPPFDFLARAFLPLVARMGPRSTAVLERPGFYPAGGGAFHVEILPTPRFGRLVLLERGALRSRRATAIVAALPRKIAERELSVIGERLGWAASELAIEEVPRAVGPGNVVRIEVEHENVTEVFTGFGERGVPAEKVGSSVADEAAEYLASEVPVGRHLADQLLLPMALGDGGTFRTLEPSGHARTQFDLVRTFLGTDIHTRAVDQSAWEIEVPARPSA